MAGTPSTVGLKKRRASNKKKADCDWCKHPDLRGHRAGLCRSCYRLELRIRAVEEKVRLTAARNIDNPSGQIPPYMDWELRILLKMAECAKNEGEARQTPFPVDGLDIEHLLSWISNRLLGKDHFFGFASTVDHTFDQSQKQVLHDALNRIDREYLRKYRRKVATQLVVADEAKNG
jgi:hypothetical protein